VPAQWFAAASYGLMQLIPEDFGDKVSKGVPKEKLQAIWDMVSTRSGEVDRMAFPT
jgi:hypothetical protein